ncbi:unnamed protein product [Periconia digitata]|uniref:F-box domain-containing protein n=1 Tax=Periconia digitata TaxID=1303443 RepID=A0A9W4XHS1_9PLEO|nr:unnamed protein product [Periconia digitata]
MILDLPPEMRLRIYEYLLAAIPLSTPPSQFTGLLFSCRQIRHELEYLVVTRMRAHFLDIQQRCAAMDNDIIFAPMTTFNDVYNLKVFRVPCPRLFNRNDPFMALFYLYLGTFTIKLRRAAFENGLDDAVAYLQAPTVYVRKRPPSAKYDPTFPGSVSVETRWHFRYNYNLNRWIGRRGPNENTPAARRIICEWSTEPTVGREGRLCIITARIMDVEGLWKAEVLEGEMEGMLVGVEYSRTVKNGGDRISRLPPALIIGLRDEARDPSSHISGNIDE